MQAFVFDPLWPGLLTTENQATLAKAGVEVVLSTDPAPLTAQPALFTGTQPRILAVNPDYVGWSLPAEAYQGIPNLKAIITASTSYGWIAAEPATQQGTPIINIRNFSTDAVADWALLMLLNVARKIPLLIKNAFPLNFGSDFQTYQGLNLVGKKVGIVGLGNIGQAIAQRCHGLGMDVSYWSRSPKQCPYRSTDLVTLFAESDVIFPTLADNDQTKTLLTDALLNSLRPDAMVISIVHHFYNHALLLQRVAQGTLYGYAFEDPKPGTFTTYQGNIWAVPAYAWCTGGSLRGAMDRFVQAIADAAQGRYPTQVNRGG